MDKNIIEQFAKMPTGNLSDAFGKKGNMDCGIKPVFPEARMAGPAFTARLQPGDNLGAHIALNQAPAGSVLVLDFRGYTGAGPFGEIMALACQQRGLAGVVINGACRDSLNIKELGFPVFVRGLNPGGTVKESLGEMNVPVSCGGVTVNPGDIVVGDADGVVVIPQENAEAVLEKAQQIVVNEAKIMELIKAGESTMEIFKFNELIAKKKG
ncbi:MAG: 4-carboxy-4-hydroxy-2-oxoadipate aldolase/oxaloacetate decarboxylase [Desulfitobacterium hafniense]|nr:4-carboxy-4-hydroxy-2-oxoadipate aldolase/oxaloacetate decarboxylase [Desulfitobacterium hafniense]